MAAAYPANRLGEACEATVPLITAIARTGVVTSDLEVRVEEFEEIPIAIDDFFDLDLSCVRHGDRPFSGPLEMPPSVTRRAALVCPLFTDCANRDRRRATRPLADAELNGEVDQ